MTDSRDINENQNLAEAAIRSLNDTANRLVQEQNTLPKHSLLMTDTQQTKSKKKDAKSTVIKSIGVGGTSIFSADISKEPKKEIAPHQQYMQDENLASKEEVKEDQRQDRR